MPSEEFLLREQFLKLLISEERLLIFVSMSQTDYRHVHPFELFERALSWAPAARRKLPSIEIDVDLFDLCDVTGLFNDAERHQLCVEALDMVLSWRKGNLASYEEVDQYQLFHSALVKQWPQPLDLGSNVFTEQDLSNVLLDPTTDGKDQVEFSKGTSPLISDKEISETVSEEPQETDANSVNLTREKDEEQPMLFTPETQVIRMPEPIVLPKYDELIDDRERSYEHSVPLACGLQIPAPLKGEGEDGHKYGVSLSMLVEKSLSRIER